MILLKDKKSITITNGLQKILDNLIAKAVDKSSRILK